MTTVCSSIDPDNICGNKKLRILAQIRVPSLHGTQIGKPAWLFRLQITEPKAAGKQWLSVCTMLVSSVLLTQITK